MVDKVRKFLKKLSPKMKAKIKQTLTDIKCGNLEHLDIQKLQGAHGLYRVRIGSIRIIYRHTKDKYEIVDIEYRGSVYK